MFIIKVKNHFFKCKIKPGNLYVVDAGTYMGEFLLFMEVNAKDELVFLIMPDLGIRATPRAEFAEGLNKKIVKFIENVPKYAFQVCKKQFQMLKNNEKSNNRHE